MTGTNIVLAFIAVMLFFTALFVKDGFYDLTAAIYFQNVAVQEGCEVE